jgi:threonine synthase
MELYHGPTLAFKDVAMQFLGGMFDHVLSKQGKRVTIIGATSGDTGSAAIEAVRGKSSIDIFMMHPKGLVSEVQRRQMSTVRDSNIHNIALEGTFDDCQDMVKAMFNDPSFRARHPLSAVNSINWARIMAQIVYYITAATQLGAPDSPVSFSVPTGNFGNVFAGYAAVRMGLPVEQFLVASNSNDILTRFLDSGVMEMKGVSATTSPSMDIQISSNFERLLFEITGRDGARVAALMEEFQSTGRYQVSDDEIAEIRTLFTGACFDNDRVAAEIKHYYASRHNKPENLIDPHTAIALAAARENRRDPSVPMVVLSTAHPAKFGDTVKSATTVAPKLPDHLSDLFDREEQFDILPNDMTSVQDYIDTKVSQTA